MAGTGVEACVGAGAITGLAIAAGVFVGVGPGALMDTLGGVAGRGVSVGVGVGASVESSPQATASTMTTVNARATGLTARLPSSLGAGKPPRHARSRIRQMATLVAQSTTILYSDRPAESLQYSPL